MPPGFQHGALPNWAVLPMCIFFSFFILLIFLSEGEGRRIQEQRERVERGEITISVHCSARFGCEAVEKPVKK